VDFTFVASYGRSGSTLLMRMLGQHPAFLVRSLFPYETRSAQFVYAATHAQTVALANVTYKNVSYDAAQANDAGLLQWIGENPVDLSGSKSAAEQVYGRIAELEGKPDGRFGIEKSFGIDMLLDIAKDWPGTRALYLLRDPRSVYMSVKAFNRKRGTGGFGEEAGDEEMYRRILHFMRRARAQAKGEHALAIRYEDLVNAPEPTLEKIVAFHGLESEPDVIARMAAILTHQDAQSANHSTVSLEKSLDRWKDEATEHDFAIFQKHARRSLMVGYPHRAPGAEAAGEVLDGCLGGRLLIVHAGATECGSATIQEHLAVNAAALGEQGVLVPGHDLSPEGASPGDQNDLMEALAQREDAGPELTRLFGALAAHMETHTQSRAVISADRLSRLPGLAPHIAAAAAAMCGARPGCSGRWLPTWRRTPSPGR